MSEEVNIKKVWGGLLVNLRKQNEFMLQNMVGNLTEYFVEESKFVIVVTDETTYIALQKPQNYEIINNIVNKLCGKTVELVKKLKEVEIDETEFKLKQKLGNILKVVE